MHLDNSGHPLHSRALSVGLTQRADGQLAFASYLLDLRKRGFVPVGGDLQGPGIIHHMCLQGVVAPDSLRIDSIHAEQPNVAFESNPLTGGESCRDPIARITALSGSAFDTSYNANLSAAVGSMRGCSHILTLAHLLGSSIPWAVGIDQACHGAHPARSAGDRIFRRDIILDGADTGERRLSLTVQLTDLLWAPAPPVAPPMQRFAAELEIRLQVDVDLKTFTLLGITGAQRQRTRDTLATAAWNDLAPLLSDLAGLSMMQGVTAQLRRRFEALASERPLLDALLMVGPTLIQCTAALSESWALLVNDTSSVVGMGGMPDSCYMWRRGGALHRARRSDDPVPRI